MKTWGWNEKSKFAEMTEENARYLVMFEDTNPIGFVHFRFDSEDGTEGMREVLYWFVLNLSLLISSSYEIQLEDKVRSKGLGKFIMQVISFLFMY